MSSADSLTHYSTLRQANITRQIEWCTAGDLSLAYSGNELAGELGEFIEVCEDFDLDNYKAELADVAICIDLIALRRSITLDTMVVGSANAEQAIRLLSIKVGHACNSIKKLERESLGMKGSRSSDRELADNLAAATAYAHLIAAYAGFSLDDAVAAKFNATSEKVGLKTRYTPRAA